MIGIVKFVHIAAISIWAAGIVSLPGLYVQRAHVRGGDDLYRLQRLVRFAFVAIVSPAAFVAIMSGTALIFLRETFESWFSAKLGFVAIMAVIHVMTGLVVIRLFREGEVYPVWRFIAATAISCAVVLAILFLVLAKPQITVSLPADIFEAGGLKRLYDRVSPWPIP